MKIRILFFGFLCFILCLGQGLAQIIVPTHFPTIQMAIIASPPGGTILIAPAYTPVLESFPVCINKPITIQGQGGLQMIQGDMTNKIFVIIADGCTIQDLIFINAGGNDFICASPSGQAGAIYIMAANNIDILGCVFNDNNATWGAGIYMQNCNTVQVNSCFFGGNVAGTDGGGIKAYMCHNISILGCTFEFNHATTNVGGGISVESCANTLTYPYDVQINSCDFYENTSSLDGGAISWWESDGVIDWNTIGDNADPLLANVSKYGGGISVVNCTTPSLTLMENNDIYNNRANGSLPCPFNGGWGGGIFIENSDDTVRVQTNNQVTSNTATFYGGGIAVNAFLAPCYPRIQGNTIKYNQVTTQCDPANPNGGGGICVNYNLASYPNHPLIANNTIQENQVLGGQSYGGGICCLYSAPAIVNNNILQNTVMDYGGGISIKAEFIPQLNRGNIMDNLIQGNYADDIGGGLYIERDDTSPVILDRNRVDNNIAGSVSGIGGGLYMMDSKVTARSNNFTNNQCADTTGTAVCVDIACTLNFYNNTVADNNMSMSYGDAMALGSPADLQNNIFSGHPNIYAIKEYFSDQTVICTNNLFWNNGHVYRDYALGERTVPELNAITGNTGNLSGNPLLDSSFYLSTSLSSAYDAGVDLSGFGVTFDIDNEVRPQGGAFEIGSDECMPTTSVKDWYLY